MAIPWFVLVTTGSPTLTGLAVLFNFLPAIPASFLGGVFVDRLGFRTCSVVADLLSAAAVAAIPLFYVTTGIDIWAVLIFVFLGSVLDAPGATARQAMFPDLVARADVGLERATGIRSAIQEGSWLVGAPLTALLIAGLGATNALWLNAGSFVVSALLIAAFIPATGAKEEEEEQEGDYFGELRRGFRFIWDHQLLRALVLTVLLTNLLDAPFTVLMPVFAEETYGNVGSLGLMYGIYGGCALLGALAYGAFGARLPRRWLFVGCFALVPVVYFVLATLPPLTVALIALALVGLIEGPLVPLIQTVQFEQVPAELRGRVFGVFKTLAWAAVPLGIFLGGYLAATIGVGQTFLLIGGLYTLVTLYGFFNPALRKL